MEMRYATKAKGEQKGKKAKVVRLHPKKRAKRTKKTDKSVTYKDVIIAFLADGLSLVEKNVNSGKFSVGAVRRAAADLKEQFPDRADLLAAFADKVQPTHTGRGRVGPKAGDERDYKAQKLGDNEPFLRLPLSVLGVKKGQLLTVRFQEDRLTVVVKKG